MVAACHSDRTLSTSSHWFTRIPMASWRGVALDLPLLTVSCYMKYSVPDVEILIALSSFVFD